MGFFFKKKYRSSKISFNRKWTRLAFGRVAMKALKSYSHAVICLYLQKSVQAIVFSVIFYRNESWTLKKQARKDTDIFELWYRRGFLRILWTVKKTKHSSSNKPIQIFHSRHKWLSLNYTISDTLYKYLDI